MWPQMQHDMTLHDKCVALCRLFEQHAMQCEHVLVALFELFQGMCGPPHEHDLAARERAQWEGSDPPMTSIL